MGKENEGKRMCQTRKMETQKRQYLLYMYLEFVFIKEVIFRENDFKSEIKVALNFWVTELGHAFFSKTPFTT